ncbi:ArsR/SmtB family transcription factor [Cellulomonas sp. McL0617]|uniref:ArsR/SmtB family transcription factor n=1 Tax=Cellulomonas sp. McL0617 TaxID=3415675 RepID=UPI003CE90456
MSIELVFQALADPTRRALIERLGAGPLSVSELARPLPLSLAAVVQHVQVLEQCGLIRTEKTGRVRTCVLAPAGFTEVERWLSDRRTVAERRFDRLETLLARDQPEAPGT